MRKGSTALLREREREREEERDPLPSYPSFSRGFAIFMASSLPGRTMRTVTAAGAAAAHNPPPSPSRLSLTPSFERALAPRSSLPLSPTTAIPRRKGRKKGDSLTTVTVSHSGFNRRGGVLLVCRSVVRSVAQVLLRSPASASPSHAVSISLSLSLSLFSLLSVSLAVAGRLARSALLMSPNRIGL